MDKEKNVQEIPIEDIIPNRFQPRLTFNEEGLNELSESIKQHGIIQPLVVRELGDKYEIIAGERRYKAATQAGLTKVPVIISDLDDNKSAEVALVENIQRRNLTAIEEAKSYKNLLDRGYLTQDQLASKMGVSQASIANKLRLLNLDSEVQDALLNEKISERHARALLTIEDNEEQKKWLKRILNERMTVRQLDIELKKSKENNDEDNNEGIPLVNINPDIEDILNKAEDINTIRTPHDVASMLMPDINIVKEEPKIEERVPTEPSTKEVPNKFFNFLEDEQVNMDIEEEPEDIFNSFIPTENLNNIEETTKNNIINPTEPEEIIENNIIEDHEQVQKEEPILNNIEILDDLDSIPSEITKEPNVTNNIVQEIKQEEFAENNIINPTEPEEIIEEHEQAQKEEPEETKPLEPVFFNESVSNSIIEEPLETTNNEIEEVKPIIEEKIIDPMDSVIKLEPDYEEKQEEEAGIDLKSIINRIRETIDDLNQKGCEIELEEADLENSYHITIEIKKD